MSHEQAESLIARQFERRDLDEHEMRALRAHLRSCAACRRLYDRYADLEEALNPALADLAAAERAFAPPPPSATVTRPVAWHRRAAALAPALAAGIVAVIILARPDPPAFTRFDYALTARPGAASERRSASAAGLDAGWAAPSVLAPDQVLSLTLRPDLAHREPVDVRVYGVFRDRWRELQVSWQRDQGVLHSEVVGQDILPEPGLWQLYVVVGYPSALPSTRELEARAEGQRPPYREQTDRWTLWALSYERR